MTTASLPDIAYQPLPPGAVYAPLVPASAALPELTARSVGWGLFLCVIFTVASAYSGLKVGQVMEAAIPISILAIGLARKSAALQHTRKRHDHGHRRSGRLRGRGRHLHPSGALHSEARHAPDFFVTTFHVWKEYLDFQFVPAVRANAERARMGLSFDAIGFILGLGYVMGLRSSMILCAGGVLSNLVLAPLIWMIGSHLTTTAVYPAQIPIAQMTAAQIVRAYVRFVGVGAIATAGIFGILKSVRVMAGSFAIAALAFRRGHAADDAAFARTDRDISVLKILIGVVAGALGIAILLGRLAASPAAILRGIGRRGCSRSSSPPWPPMRLPLPPATPSPA